MADLAAETSAKTIGEPKAADLTTIPPRSGTSLGNAETIRHLGPTGPGASSAATIPPRSGASLGNAATNRHHGATGLGGSPGAMGMHSRHGQTALGPDTDVTGLTFTQLEDELRGIQSHLDENPVSSPENDRLIQRLVTVRAELAKRRRQEAVGHARRPEGAAATRVPRSATESLRIDATMADAELNDEINAIHDALRFGVSTVDRSILRSSLARLEAERLRRLNEAVARARVEAIRRAFMPRAGSDDRATLIELMTKIESVRPSGSTPGLYSLVYDGKLLLMTASEYEQIRASARQIMSDNLRKVRTKAESAEYQYQTQLEINQDQWLVSGLVQFFGRIKDPGESIRQNVRFAKANADAAQALVARGYLVRGAEFFAQSEVFATLAKKASQAWVNNLIETAETTVTVLEVTAVAAAATFVVIAAILAAPLVVSAAQAAPLVLMLSTAAVPAAEVTAATGTAVEVTVVVGTAAEVTAAAGTAAEVTAAAGTAAEVTAAAPAAAAAAAPAAAPAAAAAAPAAAAVATPAAATPAVTSAAALATAAAASTTLSSDSPAPADPGKEEEEKKKKPKVPSGRLRTTPKTTSLSFGSSTNPSTRIRSGCSTSSGNLGTTR